MGFNRSTVELKESDRETVLGLLTDKERRILERYEENRGLLLTRVELSAWLRLLTDLREIHRILDGHRITGEKRERYLRFARRIHVMAALSRRYPNSPSLVEDVVSIPLDRDVFTRFLGILRQREREGE